MASQDAHPFHWHYADLDDRDFQIRGRTLFFIVVVFSVLLLITLLFLYARWVCRYHSLSSLPPTTSHAPEHRPGPTQGLDPLEIKGLPIILHDVSSSAGPDCANSGSDCCICLSVFEAGEKVKVLPKCLHCFHSDCVDVWLATHSSCPLCRVSLRLDSADDSGLLQIVLD